MNDYSYKLGFVFAAALHVVLMIFLFIKFTTSSKVFTLNQAVTINATVVNDISTNNSMTKIPLNALPKQKEQQKQDNIANQTLPEPIEKPQTKDKIEDILQESLMLEHAKEIAELKKAKQARKKSIAKKQEQQMQKMLHDQVIAEQKQLSDELSDSHSVDTANNGDVDKYKAMVAQAITSQWIVPDGVNENDFDKESIDVAPGGTVISTKSIDSSNNAVMNRSAQAAILKASPLPVPNEPELFDEFRKINLKFTSKGIASN